MAESTTITLATTGMHCGSCAMLIDMTLGDVEGVSAVSTDYGTGMCEVTIDPDVVGVDEILAAVRAMGYDAEVA